MQFIVIFMLSLVTQSFADVLTLSCGDELCEKTSNRAVTTLRYTPDKPYKLQIHAVNSEVEIYGATDELYYVKYGRNYGFLPKQHLREKARGKFPHTVKIDIKKIQINQEIRERNYINEFVKSLNTEEKVTNEPAVNNNAEKKQVSEENSVASDPAKEPSLKSNDEQNTVVNDRVQEPKLDKEQNNEVKEEKVNANERVQEPTVNTVVEKRDVPEKNNKTSDRIHEPAPNDNVQPKGASDVASDRVHESYIPTGIEPTISNSNVSTSDEEQDANDSGIEEEEEDDDEEGDDDDDENDIFDSDTKEQEKVSEEITTEAPKVADIPEVVENVVITDTPIQTEIVTEENVLLKVKDEANNLDSKVEEQEPVLQKQPENSEEKIPLNDIKESEPEKSLTDNDAAKEIPTQINDENLQKLEKPDYENQNDISKENTEKIDPITEPPPSEQVEEIKTESYENVLPLTDENTISHNHSTVDINPPQTEKLKETVESFVPVDQKPSPKFNEDMLLKRFDEKLGHIGSEHIGSAEEILHDHAHSHEHTHSNVVVKSEKEIEEESSPGFFGSIINNIFGDKSQDEMSKEQNVKTSVHDGGEYCEKIDAENCPKSTINKIVHRFEKSTQNWDSLDSYLKIILTESVEYIDLIISMGLTAITVLIFIFGYYCINKTKKETPLIAKVNEVERHLMAAIKENEMLKSEVIVTKQKLASIEDNSFGSNDMVIALKNEIDANEKNKNALLEKISSLEKELEAAAEDGLELNRMVSELLSSQTGSDSIISSVEDLQQQLNEQQEIIVTMNETLAVKSRENSELQIELSHFKGKFNEELEKVQQENNTLSLERSSLQSELENIKRENELRFNQLTEEQKKEAARLNTELSSYTKRYEETRKLLNTAESKIQALEECVETVMKGGNVKDLIDVADLKADLLAVTKEKSTIQEQLQSESDARKLLEARVKTITEEMSNLKKGFIIAEKDKLEAQTRLDVLSAYFKEKEMQLQQELSVKEARWMKQQGETTSTVEKIQALNDEIQNLRSQNESLRAEIETQMTADKAKISSFEAQAHNSWLNSRQTERKLEEARMEAAALRRRLTAIAENPTGASELLSALPGMSNDSMNSIPSPMRVESPNNLNMNSLPPGPPLNMLPPFLPGGPLPPFIPPFLPPAELSSMMPPHGRLMSPPPKRFTPTMRDDRADRYSPRGRGRYSPDSRYDDYTAFETETDYSPPRTPSPPPHRRDYNYDRNLKSKGGSTDSDSKQHSRRK